MINMNDKLYLAFMLAMSDQLTEAGFDMSAGRL